MQIRTVIWTALVLALVVAGTTGCRNSRRAAQQGSDVCQAPCPTPCPPQPYCPPEPYCPPQQTYVAPCPPQPCAPPTTYCPPQPPCPPPVAVSPRPAPPQDFGSPDGSYGGTGFPTAAPSNGLMATIQEERRAREAMERELVAAQERLRLAEQAIVAPPKPCAPAAGLSSAGGSAEADAFAAALRQRSCGDVEVQGDVVVIRFADAFVAGSERLKGDPAQMTALLSTAEELGRRPGAFVEVVGHSDSDPIKKSKWRDNVHLSQERAQTVANALAKRGVPAGRMAVTGRGSAEPVVYPERSAGDKARNRRVEVRVQF